MAAKKKESEKRKKQEITRSSAVEYLTFVAAQGEGGVEVVYAESEFEKYRIVQDRLFESDFDREFKRPKAEEEDSV